MKKILKNILWDFNSIRFISMMLITFICLTIITLVSSGTYLAYKSNTLHIIGTNRSHILSQIGSRVRDYQSSSITISNLYYNDQTFNEFTKNLNNENVDEFSKYMDELTKQYQLSFNQINLDFYVVYLSVDGIGYSSIEVPKDYDYINPEIRIWYKDLYKANGEIVNVGSYKDKFLDKISLLSARTVLSENQNVVGYLMINIDEQQIYETYKDVVDPVSNIYISDSEGNIISSNVKKIIGFHYFNMDNLKKLFSGNAYSIVQLPENEALFSKYSDNIYNFTVFEETPLDYILAPLRQTRNTVVIISVIVSIIAVILAWIFSGRITKPIMKLRDYVLDINTGNMTGEFKLKSYSEIDTLSINIQQMLYRIHQLVESDKEKENQKHQMQFNLLQAQINPHFMYNTLFSIKCVVDMNKNKTASEMLSAFIQLLRRTLSNPDKLMSISNQMDALQQYADLQKFRYGDQFEVVIQYDKEIENCLLPSLIIQPLVENAIIHGVGKFENYGVIVVSAFEKDSNIIIEVEDNGHGMSKEQISSIFESTQSLNKKHIGIKNINERIKLLFGEEYGISIESKLNEGTKITITVPRLYEESEVEILK